MRGRRICGSITLLLFACGMLGVLGACSASSDNTFGTTNGPQANAGGATGGSGMNGAGHAGSMGGSAYSGTGSAYGTGAEGNGLGITVTAPPPADARCQGIVNRGEELPLDIYVMFDTSYSMNQDVGGGTTRLNAVRNAIGQFVGDPASSGIGIGIGYFGVNPLGQADCNAASYQNAEVPIAALPGNAMAITQSLAGKNPTGETPTPAAIQGACTYAKAWATAHPSHVTVILLVTDGVPEAPVSSQRGGCNPTLPDAITAATNCDTQDPKLPIYVLGVGPTLQNLQQIAQAGGTQQAYLVEGGNVSQAVLAALTKIRGSAKVPCQYTVPKPPAGHTLDPLQVNVQYTPPMGPPGVVYGVDNAAACTDVGGWYYNPEKTLINLCPSTCTRVSTDIGGTIEIALGCATERPPVK